MVLRKHAKLLRSSAFSLWTLAKHLFNHPSVPKWRNGRRRGFKIPRLHGRVSSNLTLGTTHPRTLLISLYLRNKLAFEVLIQVLI